MRNRLPATLLATSIGLSTMPARAEAPNAGTPAVATPAQVPPQTRFRPNAPLAMVGGGLFALAYAPPLATSVSGLFANLENILGPPAGYVAGNVASLLIPCVSLTGNCRGPDLDPDPKKAGTLVLALPVIGPLLYRKHHGTDATWNRDGRAPSEAVDGLLVASAIAQGVGLALVGASFVLGKEVSASGAPREKPPTFGLAPMPLDGGFGLTLVASP